MGTPPRDYDYGQPVSSFFWIDSKTWSDDARIMGLYLLTGPHRKTEGLYRLPLSYIEPDLRWDRKRIEKALAELEEAGFQMYDHDVEVVFIRKALKYQAPRSESQIKGAMKALRQVPRTPLFEALLESAERYTIRFAEAIREGIDYPFDRVSDTPTDTLSGPPTPTPTPTPTHPESASSDDEDAATRDDVENLCSLLAQRLIENGVRKTAVRVTGAWRDEARRLLDLDKVTLSEAERVLEWSQQDDFWKQNIHSMPTFRKQFDKLRLRMIAENPDPADDEPPPLRGKR